MARNAGIRSFLRRRLNIRHIAFMAQLESEQVQEEIASLESGLSGQEIVSSAGHA